MKKVITLMLSHVIALTVGVGLGIYILPILIAPPSPEAAKIDSLMHKPLYRTRFERDRQGSDLLHWGEGDVVIGKRHISFIGKLAPGPDYKLYLVPTFVEDEAGFENVKAASLRVGNIDTFDNFIVELNGDIDFEEYTTVVVWCEAFSEFITSAKYR